MIGFWNALFRILNCFFWSRCAQVELAQVFETANSRGGLEETDKCCFLAGRGPRGIGTYYLVAW